MQTVVCPRCGKHILHSSGDLPAYCDGVSCGHTFAPLEQERTLPAREGDEPEAGPVTVPEVPPPPSVSAPQLIAPHVCPLCPQPITRPAGVRRSTITHVCGNRTDLFAVIFRAPCCCAFVEMPLARAGQEVDCPACPRRFRGPRDDILHRLTGDIRSGELMAFICPNDECRTPLQANTHIDGVPVAGQAVVCPACLNVFAMPSAGTAVRRSP